MVESAKLVRLRTVVFAGHLEAEDTFCVAIIWVACDGSQAELQVQFTDGQGFARPSIGGVVSARCRVIEFGRRLFQRGTRRRE